MSYKRYVLVPNGDCFTKIYFYECDKCKDEICEMDWFYCNKNIHYCRDCAYIKGFFSHQEYKDSIGCGVDRIHPYVINGKIYFWIGHKRPELYTDEEFRKSAEYKRWRNKVLERDGKKCVKCGETKKLHAHHIKPFKEFIELRVDIDNGITLCHTCHIKEHKKKAVIQ